MTDADSSSTDAASDSVRPSEFWVVLVLALAALFKQGGAADRWINRRLGAVSSGGTSIEEVGRELSVVTDEAAGHAAVEESAGLSHTEAAQKPSIREAQLRYLNGIRDQVRADVELDQTKLDRYERYDLLVIRSRLMAGALTLMLAIAGVVLVATGFLPLALVTGAVAIIPGAGTLGLTKLTDLLEKRLDQLRQKHESNRETLRSIDAMLAIGDEGMLDAELSKLARRFAGSGSGGTGDA